MDTNEQLDIIYFSNISENTKRLINRLSFATPIERSDLAENSPDKRIEGSINVYRIPLQTHGQELTDFSEKVSHPYVLIFPTYGRKGGKGMIPPQVLMFTKAENTIPLCKGLIGTGQRNFGKDYCKGVLKMSYHFGIPIIRTMELSGMPEDIDFLNEHWEQLPEVLQHKTQELQEKLKTITL